MNQTQNYQIVFPSDDTSVNVINKDYIKSKVSLASENEYIPIDCLSTGSLITVDGKKDFMYSLNVNITPYSQTGNTKIFGDHLLSSNSWSASQWYSIKKTTLNNIYMARHGILVHRVKEELLAEYNIPLMLIGVKREYLFSIDRVKPDINQFCLLIDKKFINDEEYFKLYRNVKKHYIDYMDKHIDILYCNNLEKLCFNRKSALLPKLSTFTELNNHIKDLNLSIQAELNQLVIERKI